jgi:DNA-directed RNA polymerase specialized sigma24 family protein
MTTEISDAGGDHAPHVALACEKNYARLRRYFLRQLGDASEADECVQETFRRLLVFMENRLRERDEERISIYLMRIAGLLHSEKLAEKNSRGADGLRDEESEGVFGKIRGEAT